MCESESRLIGECVKDDMELLGLQPILRDVWTVDRVEGPHIHGVNG